MPYLKKYEKDAIDDNALDLYKKLSDMKPDELAGAVNYLNFKILKQWIALNGKKYWIFALFCGTMLMSIFEIYRRLVAPYEDEKIKQNGDVE